MKRYVNPKLGERATFADAVQADGWLYVSGQCAMQDGEFMTGPIASQARKALEQLLEVLEAAGYAKEHVVRCAVCLDDPRDFNAFNVVFRAFFGEHKPARSCVVSRMVVDSKVEIDCVAFKAP